MKRFFLILLLTLIAPLLTFAQEPLRVEDVKALRLKTAESEAKKWIPPKTNRRWGDGNFKRSNSMEPRFTRGEYWLLDTVVEFRFPVSGLMDSNLEGNLNKKGHGLTRTALLETLHHLTASGLISAENEVDGVISTHQHIERALNEPIRRIPRVGERKRRIGLTHVALL